VLDVGVAQDCLRMELSGNSHKSLVGATACAIAISWRTHSATGQIGFRAV
jgi:hypothetical protein